MYGVQKPSAYEAVESFFYRNWFKDIYNYIHSRTHIVTKTTAYTIEADVFLVRADATSAGFTITLPTASQKMGRQIAIKKIDASANNVTVDGAGAETIDGAATLVWNTQYVTYILISNGSNWDIL